MIIKKITVENWRTLKNPLTLEFCDGFNIIQGDNGQGKSTVMEALRMGFLDRHNVSGDDIRKIRPWGCELNPRVEIEFCHGGKKYRLAKRFIGQKSCIVEMMDEAANEYRRFMESDGADAWLRSILSGEASAKGIGGKPEHWGLAGLLWVPQGVSDYQYLSGALMKRITDSKRQPQDNERIREGSIEGTIRREYLNYFTDGDKARTGGGSLKDIESQIAQKRAVLNQKRRQLESMENLRDDIAAARERIKERDAEITGIQKRLKEAETKIAEYDRLKAEHEAAKARRDLLESDRKLLERDISDIKEARSVIDRYKKQIAARTKEIDDTGERMKRIDSQISEKIAEKHKIDSLIKLEFKAEADVAWEPIDGESTNAGLGIDGGNCRVSAGGTAAIEGIGRVRVRLPNVGTITATGPVNDNAAALQERIASLRQQHESYMKAINDHKRDINVCNEAIERANAKISEILVDGKTLECVAEDHRKILGELHVVSGKMSEYKDQVTRLGYNPHKEIGELQKKSESLREQRERDNKLVFDCQGQLKALGGLGLYEEADALDEELRKIETSFNSETIRAKAFKLIWDTVRAVKLEYQKQVSSPVEKRASELFALVNGRHAGTVKLNDKFGVVGFVPEEQMSTPVATDDLSGGEREQLYFCARLALAERVIGDDVSEKYALMLDDSLTATDDKRLGRLTELLLTFENRYQYLIFTCHKDRYADINGVDVRVMEI